MAEELVKYVAVDSDETLNTSDHVPVFAILNLEVTQKGVNGNKTIKCTPRLETCVRHVYGIFVDKDLKMCLLCHLVKKYRLK